MRWFRVSLLFCTLAEAIVAQCESEDDGSCKDWKDEDDSPDFKAQLLQTSHDLLVPESVGVSRKEPDGLSKDPELAYVPSLPPILMLKTHKTGSSTLINIVQRMGDVRDLRFMLPQDFMPSMNVRLGFPDPFPGEDNALVYGPPNHELDVICHHAVLNISLMKAYLKPNPHFITLAREPVSMVISAKNQFFTHTTWDAYMVVLEASARMASKPPPHTLNQMAYDFGWYDFVGGSTEFDQDEYKINEFLITLDNAMSASKSIILTEAYDQGLVLLRRHLRVSFEEVMYTIKKDSEESGTESIEPTEQQRQRIFELNLVDRAVYDHLSRCFWEEWSSGNVTQLEAEYDILQDLNEKLVQDCIDGDMHECPERITATAHDYTVHLHEKEQDEKTGVKNWLTRF